ncbi:protein psiQ isoform X2 [Eupeodes corollae]|uniref:protein psiQ isoform X2 n=1 Tax=Eupeodes corollae TaxID=290404 RepID=UPI00249139EF|nr:protein psiQ isoform X2 [Eupeodes corollae]
MAIGKLNLAGKSSEAITCYKCDSVTLSECATSLDSETWPIEECKSGYSCASSIVDSVTYRGCSSNTPRGPKYYKTCSENLCNEGVFPPGRLKCHQCSGINCVPKQITKPKPCVNFDENDNCYTDVIDEQEVYRACDSDPQTIRTPTQMAVYCDFNGCNNLTAVETLTCSKCDSYNGRGCKMDLFEIYNTSCVINNNTTCSDLSMLGHEQPSCFLYTNLDHVVRGCSYDSEKLSLDAENFETCYSSLCNKNCLKQQKCIICDSQTNGECIGDPGLLTVSTCEGAEASSCHSCESKDGSVQRGCGVPSRTPDSRCYECQGEGCNKSNFTKCYKCTSDESPNCGQWANPNIIDVESCEIAGAGCISAVFPNGKTLRGCESPQLKCNGTQSSCYACSGSLCNNGVYPAVRLQCHHCDGRAKCSNIFDNSTVLPCAEYDKNDACFEFLSGRKTMVRGCRSDRTLFYECLLATQNGNGCRLCAGSGCNNTPASRPASLSCHKCSREHQGCSWFQDNRTLEKCQNEVTFLTMESCFTRRFLNGTISRGCSLDLNENEVSGSVEFLEYTCDDEGCNDKSQVAQKCIACRGKIIENKTCITEVGSLESVQCGDDSMKFEERGCYTKIDGDFIERGCASTLSIPELQQCQQSSEKECFYCQGIECNTSSNFTFIVLPKNFGSRIIFQTSLVKFYFIAFLLMTYFNK